jgi:CO dehydrogenase maturation factor
MCRTHATVRRVLGELVAAGDDMTVVDMEAGLEHLSRGTTRGADTMLVVAEPYFKSLETARRGYALASELNIPRVFVVANKARGPRDDEAIRTFCERHQLQLLATVPFDDAVSEAELGGAAVLDVNAHAPSVTQIQRLADLVTAS